MQEECGGGGAHDTSGAAKTTTTPVVSPSTAGGSSRGTSTGEDNYAQHPPPKLGQSEEVGASSTGGVNGDSVSGACRLGETVGDTQAIVGGVGELNLAPSVASLWSQDDPTQLLSSIPAINGSVGFGGHGGSVGPQLFGGASLARLSAQRSISQPQQQPVQRGIFTGPTSGVGPASGPSGSTGFLGTKVSSSWSSGLGQASAWSTGAQGAIAGPAGGQGGGPGGPVGAVAWGRGRGTNMSHNLGGNMRGATSGQPCPSVGVGKVPQATLAAKFRRSTSYPGKSGMLPQHGPFPHQQIQQSHLQGHMPPSFEITVPEDARDYLQFQECGGGGVRNSNSGPSNNSNGPLDSMRDLQHSLSGIMREQQQHMHHQQHDPSKGYVGCGGSQALPPALTAAHLHGKGSYLGLEESLLMEEHHQQQQQQHHHHQHHHHQHLVDALGAPMGGAHQLNTNPLGVPMPLTSPSRSSPRSQASDNGERFSRKVFVGGLPPDIDEEEITASFRRFGQLVVDWPHKAESKSYFPPKGYAFLLFQDESSVQQLIDTCIKDDDKLYLCVSSPTIKDKPVQIRPWRLTDADFVLDGSLPLDPRKTVFVGGVPRPLKAVELATIMDRLYGGVCYAGIDTDPELKYPKGAGRVAFSNQQSYIAAISARFVQLQHGDIDKRVEVKPYVLDDQMCDECQGTRCGGKFAPFFCATVTCLQYYCEHCWQTIHSRPGRELHKPLVKEGADRPRTVPFRWC